jgi:hypothetical protein
MSPSQTRTDLLALFLQLVHPMAEVGLVRAAPLVLVEMALALAK